MTLTPCPSCSHQISPNAMSCPKCGALNFREEIKPARIIDKDECPMCERRVRAHEEACTNCGEPNKHYIKSRLKPCLTCNHNVSPNAEKCPNCNMVDPTNRDYRKAHAWTTRPNKVTAFCGACNAPLKQNVSICLNCGSTHPENDMPHSVKRCRNCQRKVAESALNCRHCGEVNHYRVESETRLKEIKAENQSQWLQSQVKSFDMKKNCGCWLTVILVCLIWIYID